MGIGLLLIAAALCLVAYNLWDSARAGQESDAIVHQLDGDDGDGSAPEGPSVDGMPTKTVNGYEYIGELEIPVLSLRLPVQANWDYDRLRVSPCRYTGSYVTDDLVVCGHNYPSHFRGLLGIGIGADVYFVTVDGERIHYVVTNREILRPTSIEQMTENDNNSDSAYDWDLTLFTCTIGGRTRCSVRCVRAEDSQDVGKNMQ